MTTASGSFGVGIIGAGNISDQYLQNLTTFPDLEVLAIGDLDEARAASQAEKYGVPTSGGVDAVLGHPEIDIIVNLTIPAVHVEVSLSILAAGKHVWSEKPIGVDRESSRKLLETATAAGLRVGIAPDTVLGPGVQTAKRAIEAGIIGRPLFAQTAFQWQGPEIFHPNPAFLYAVGGGPLLDMGPYYVSTLVHVFGPVASVVALGQTPHATRTVQVGELAGTEFPVEIPSTVSVLMQFEGGGQASSLYSTDSALRRAGFFEVSGTEGTLTIPDPNTFGGSISVIRPYGAVAEMVTGAGEMAVQQGIEIEQEGVLVGRGLGLLDMARAIRDGRPHIASGELGFHVLDTLLAIEESAAFGSNRRGREHRAGAGRDSSRLRSVGAHILSNTQGIGKRPDAPLQVHPGAAVLQEESGFELGVESDLDSGECLADGAGGLRVLCCFEELGRVDAGDLATDGEVDAGDLQAAIGVGAERDIGLHLEGLHGAAGRTEHTGELHRIARRMCGRDELLRAGGAIGAVGGALREGDIECSDLRAAELDLSLPGVEAAVPGGAGGTCGHVDSLRWDLSGASVRAGGMGKCG